MADRHGIPPFLFNCVCGAVLSTTKHLLFHLESSWGLIQPGGIRLFLLRSDFFCRPMIAQPSLRGMSPFFQVRVVAPRINQPYTTVSIPNITLIKIQLLKATATVLEVASFSDGLD